MILSVWVRFENQTFFQVMVILVKAVTSLHKNGFILAKNGPIFDPKPLLESSEQAQSAGVVQVARWALMRHFLSVCLSVRPSVCPWKKCKSDKYL